MDSVLIARKHLSDAQRAARDALLEAETAFELANAEYQAAFRNVHLSDVRRLGVVQRWRAAL